VIGRWKSNPEDRIATVERENWRRISGLECVLAFPEWIPKSEEDDRDRASVRSASLRDREKCLTVTK
jgi:hypothetical protein